MTTRAAISRVACCRLLGAGLVAWTAIVAAAARPPRPAPHPSAHAIHYYHPDHLGSNGAITDDSGTIVGRRVFSAFGRTVHESGTGVFEPAHQFTDHVRDTDTGLDYFGARYFDPELGRFVQADSIIPDPMDPQSLDRFAYVLNNPLRLVDPTGHSGEEGPATATPPSISLIGVEDRLIEVPPAFESLRKQIKALEDERFMMDNSPHEWRAAHGGFADKPRDRAFQGHEAGVRRHELPGMIVGKQLQLARMMADDFEARVGKGISGKKWMEVVEISGEEKAMLVTEINTRRQAALNRALARIRAIEAESDLQRFIGGLEGLGMNRAAKGVGQATGTFPRVKPPGSPIDLMPSPPIRSMRDAYHDVVEGGR